MATQYQQPYQGYGPNAGRSGGDPRGRVQNQSQYQQQRYESQQGPMVNQMAYNYGRGSEADYGNYADIMNNYRNIATGAPGTGGGGGFSASHIGYNDPFNSYKGFTEFSNTGGYSPQDIANMRARGVSPIRAAYANAEREIGRQRALQGGYSPNAIASRVKMAREQGQGMADATQNVEAGLAESRNRGRLAGLTGMSDIEKQRLAADLEVGKFNASADMSAGASASAAASQNAANRLDALSGMRMLYGTTPGMSETFGNQLLSGVGQGGNFGLGLMGRDIESQQLPGAWDTTMGRIGDVAGMASTVAYPWLSNNTGVGGGSQRNAMRIGMSQGGPQMRNPGINPNYGGY